MEWEVVMEWTQMIFSRCSLVVVEVECNLVVTEWAAWEEWEEEVEQVSSHFISNEKKIE